MLGFKSAILAPIGRPSKVHVYNNLPDFGYAAQCPENGQLFEIDAVPSSALEVRQKCGKPSSFAPQDSSSAWLRDAKPGRTHSQGAIRSRTFPPYPFHSKMVAGSVARVEGLVPGLPQLDQERKSNMKQLQWSTLALQERETSCDHSSTGLDEHLPGDQTSRSCRARPAILVVDQDLAAANALMLRLKLAGFRCVSAKDAPQALDLLKTECFDGILADLRTSRLLGTSLLSEVRKHHRTVPFILLARPSEAYVALKEMKDGADDCLIKPLNAKDVLKNLRRVLARRRTARSPEPSTAAPRVVSQREAEPPAIRSSADSYESTLLALGAALDLRDSETAGHSKRVCMYSLEMAQRLGCSGTDFKVLRQGALLHDIGKLAIPDAILWKPGPLTPEEWVIMKTHVNIGHQLVRDIPFLNSAAELILTHHERHDGAGYPRGLAGAEIPLCARIFAVADTFDAMTSLRPYHQPIPLAVAVEQVRRQRGRSFDPRVVDAFLQIPERTLSFIHETYSPNVSSVARSVQQADLG